MLSLGSHLTWDYARVALYSTCASPFGYAALKHVDYPTMILAKSCKLVPVIIMSFVLHRRTFHLYKYLSVAMITVGVSAFMLLHSDNGKSDGMSSSLWGLLLLLINLAIDGATNSTQDHIFIKHSISGAQMMFYMNLFSALIMLVRVRSVVICTIYRLLSRFIWQ
jgi:UDP-galactose transporter B1